MRSFVRLLSALVLLLARAEASVAACSDPAAAAAVRGQCDCASAANHGAYVSCVAHATNAAVKAGTLPDDCASTVMNCASNSTCGKPGFVTCCRTDAGGITCPSAVTHGSWRHPPAVLPQSASVVQVPKRFAAEVVTHRFSPVVPLSR